MIRVLAAALALCILAGASPARAVEQVGDDNAIKVDDSTVTAGQTVRATARRFRGSVRFEVSEFGEAVGTATADHSGIAYVSFVLPAVPLGVRRLEASGTSAEGGNLRLTASLRVIEGDDGVHGPGSSAVRSSRIGRVNVLRFGAVVFAVALFLVAGLAKRRRSHVD